MREIVSGLLWIGHARDARDLRRLLGLEIQAVVDLAMEEPPIQFPRGVIYCRFPLYDGEGNSPSLLRAAIETTTGFFRSQTPTLVACSGGMSRSPAIAAAAVARVESLKLDEAMGRVAGSGSHDVSPQLWKEIREVTGEGACRLPFPDFLASVINTFLVNKELADKAIAQVTDDKLHVALDANTNSIAVIMKHVAGNLLSRWTTFLTTDGEKPDRNRDEEFIDRDLPREQILEHWEQGWKCLLSALKSLTLDDIKRKVQIRGEEYSVPLAMERSLGHTCYHIGQIVQLARIHAGDHWTTLTIPRGQSEQYTRDNWGGKGKAKS